MDDPKTRRETKKSAKEKAKGKGAYSAKRVRQLEALKEKQQPTQSKFLCETR